MKVSLCTVCMNRVEHLKQTLEKNIADNSDHIDTEFVLLDYNSNDDLELYIKDNLNHYIKTNKLIYYKTKTPIYFNRSHSRNLAFKLATGDIICNVDADNFTGTGFAAFLNNAFNKKKKKFVYANERFDVIGRIAVTRDDFYNVGGFDERMAFYGFEDTDFLRRLIKSGLSADVIKEKKFLSAVSHSNKERMANEYVVNNYFKLFICYLTPSASVLSILFKDNFFYEGTIVNRLNLNTDKPELVQNSPQYDYGIKETDWIKGEWRQAGSAFTFLYDVGETKILKPTNTVNVFQTANSNNSYYEITDKSLVEDALFFYSQLTNRIVLEKNAADKNYKVNNSDFGKDTVYKNFCDNPINV